MPCIVIRNCRLILIGLVLGLSIGCAVDKKKPKMMMAPDSHDAAKDISRSLHVPRIGVR